MSHEAAGPQGVPEANSPAGQQTERSAERCSGLGARPSAVAGTGRPW